MNGDYNLIPLYLAAIVFLLGLFIVFLLLKGRFEARQKEASFKRGLKSAITYEGTKVNIGKTINEKIPVTEKIVKHWRRAFPNDVRTDDQIRSLIVLISASAFIVGLLFTGNVIAAASPVMVVIAGIVFLSNKKETARLRLLEEQIPGFIATFKGNLQANQTNSKALLNAINQTASPLYDELYVAKALIQTSTFKSALVELRHTTTSDTMRFLCSSIELASDTGGSLEPQVEEIEELVKVKREHERKLDKAEAEGKPLIYVSAVVVPAMFFYTYIANDSARAFWFVDSLSWILLGIIIVLWVAALFMSNRITQSIRGDS